MTETNDNQAEYRGEALAARAVIGGGLMGLANLVPGISGGTMLLAAGVYPHFIQGVADISTFRFRARSLLLLACIVGAAAAAVVGFAGPVSELVVQHRWAMYALFIGLTLGGVPVLWEMVRPLDATVIVAAAAGLAVMVAMAFIGPGQGAVAADGSHPYGLYLVAGLAGASAMVLPGISGGYLLLLLGQYVAILTAVASLKDGVRTGLQGQGWAGVGEPLHVLVPVGIGVVAGVVGVSNLVKWLLAKVERPTLGVLLGLLLGAVIGLWPFQRGVPPAIGSELHGDVVVEGEDGRLLLRDSGKLVEPDAWPTQYFGPTALQITAAAGLILAGFAGSWGVSHLGGRGSAAGSGRAR